MSALGTPFGSYDEVPHSSRVLSIVGCSPMLLYHSAQPQPRNQVQVIMSTIPSQPTYESEPPPPERRYPRYKIVGGFDISTPIATAWASRLVGEELHPYHDQPSVSMVLSDKVRPHGADFVDVTETNEPAYMLITQSARFNGYKGIMVDESDQPIRE
jgi:hypothetical protein